MPDTISNLSTVSVSNVRRISYIAMPISSSLGVGAGLSGKRRLQAAPPGFPIVPESGGVCQSAAAALFLSNLVCYSGQTKEYYMSQEETLDQLLERIRSRFRVDFKPLDIDGREHQVLDV